MKILALIDVACQDGSCGEEWRVRLKKDLETVILEQGINRILCALELEAGLTAAEIVLELRERYPITLECVIPYEEYTTDWPEIHRDRYFRIVEHCDRENMLQKQFTGDCMVKKNEYLKTKADVLFYLK